MTSRIDIIGQNGGDGLHYNYEEILSNAKAEALKKTPPSEKEFVKKLIEDHWKYIEGVLEHHVSIDDLSVIRFHYKTAMEHGWRHAKEYYTGSV